MSRKRKGMKYTLMLSMSALLLVLSSLFSLVIGEVPFSLADVPSILSDPSSMEHGILTHIRIPRTILAMAIGGSLSLCGVILQGIYRNPLVEPYTLGISGGAAVGVTLAIVTGLAMKGIPLSFFGFAGALVTIFLVYTLSIRNNRMSTGKMLLIGVMISFISSSAVMLLMSLTNAEQLHGIIFWTMGSLNETDNTVVFTLLGISVIMLGVTILFAVPLNAMRLGEAKARHLGINTTVIIRILFIITSLMTGSCIAVAGIIGFVGLIMPHFSRLIIGTDYRVLLPSAFLNGAIFLIWCDILARIIISPNELPIGVITGIFGGITFIIILSSRRIKAGLL
ncbi:MAG: FecCD family ABC transporter permease [Bacteroidales bacterium]|jgi:iron complex transport system permease protein|nr:iron ABC transporter permease [Bacteroidales bacterium]